MITFRQFLKLLGEELWNTAGPQDNPGNPGTKRKNATHYLNKKYGVSGGMAAPGGFSFGTPMSGKPPMPAPPPPPPKRMKKMKKP